MYIFVCIFLTLIYIIYVYYNFTHVSKVIFLKLPSCELVQRVSMERSTEWDNSMLYITSCLTSPVPTHKCQLSPPCSDNQNQYNTFPNTP